MFWCVPLDGRTRNRKPKFIFSHAFMRAQYYGCLTGYQPAPMPPVQPAAATTCTASAGPPVLHGCCDVSPYQPAGKAATVAQSYAYVHPFRFSTAGTTSGGVLGNKHSGWAYRFLLVVAELIPGRLLPLLPRMRQAHKNPPNQCNIQKVES